METVFWGVLLQKACHIENKASVGAQSLFPIFSQCLESSRGSVERRKLRCLQEKEQMADPIDSGYLVALKSRGEELSPGLEFILGEFLGQDAASVTVGECVATQDLDSPEGLPAAGALLLYRGKLTPPRKDEFGFGWFFSGELTAIARSAVGSDEEFASKLDELAEGMADLLATDKYTLESNESRTSSELWNDYLLQVTVENIGWLPFVIEMPDGGKFELWSAWPECMLDRMFGPAEPAKSPQPLPEPEPEVEEPSEVVPLEKAKSSPITVPEGARRLLRTSVPIIVTLAMKEIPASGLMDIGPGTIIEFERGCDQPLILSVNNLPIGLGEAVKIGDHFGLKVTAILSPQERAARVGGKWKFG